MVIANKDVENDKRIIHPIFSECGQYTLDPYWQQVFEECARGKFPKGSTIDPTGTTIYFKGRVSNNNNTNYQTYKLDAKEPEEIFGELKNYFTEQLNLKSNRDKQEIRAELDDICKDIQESYGDTWHKIKRKKIKEPIIRRYILDLKEYYNLTDKETAEVAQIIKLGFLFNWIDSDDVEYGDQRIIDIKTLKFDEEERIFELDDPGIPFKREFKSKSIKLSNLWDKHLKQPKNCYVL